MVAGNQKAIGYHAIRPHIYVFYDQRYLKFAGKSSAIASSIALLIPFFVNCLKQISVQICFLHCKPFDTAV